MSDFDFGDYFEERRADEQRRRDEMAGLVRRTVEREERNDPCTCQWCLAEWVAERERIEADR